MKTRTQRVRTISKLGAAAVVMAATVSMAQAAPTWTALRNAPPAFLNSCLLLTDATVMCQGFFSNTWHRLSPDAFGSYANGTWDTPPIAPMPNANDARIGCTNCTYAPLYFASSVLADGRVVVVGGEDLAGFPLGVETNIGFMYNPVTNTWSSQLKEAFGSGNVGDAVSNVLPNGTMLVGNLNSTDLESFNPATLTFTALNPQGKADINSEEGWNLLPNGTMLAIDSRIQTQSEIYNPATNTWGSRANTVVNMADTFDLGASVEVGPAVLRPDGRLISFSGNSLGQNALFNSATGTWSHTNSMDFPLVPGQTFHFSCKDGPATILPNGNVLVMAAPTDNVTGNFNGPSHFYELDFATNTLSPVVDSPNAQFFAAFEGHFLALPTGEVLLVAYNQGATQDVMLYTNGGAPQSAWRPVITSAPSTIVPGSTNTVAGTLFNGLSQGAAYGDDSQGFTNYPLVRITNNASGHVSYARTHNHSRMGVEALGSTETVTTQFDAAPNLELGACTLVVVTNGIASAPSACTVTGNQAVACEAGQSFLVDDRGQVKNGTGGPGAILNAGTGSTRLGQDGRSGAITSRGPVTIQHRAVVTGNVLSASTVTKDSDATVTGSITSNGTVSLPALPTLPAFPSPTMGGFTVNSGVQQTRPPGSYTSGTIINGGTLILTAGDYYFQSFTVNAGSILRAAPTTRIFVQTNLIFNASVLASTGTAIQPVFLGFAGSSLGLNARFDGTLVAPNATVMFGSGNMLTFTGSFFGRVLEVTPGSTLACRAN